MTLQIHHLALRTNDVDGLVRFYREMFAMAVVRDSAPRSVWLGIGEGAVLMIEARDPDEPSPACGSMDLFALRVDEEHKARVEALARDRGCFDGKTAFTVYLRDPDGRRVGVSTYDMDSPSAS